MHKPHFRYKNQTPKERIRSIHFIAGFKLFKGLLLLFVAVKLLTFLNKDMAEWVADFIARHRIDPDNHFVHSILEKIAGVDNRQLVALSVGSFFYSGLQITEGVGLWFEKRWAEYLTVIATSLLVPLEIYEIYEKLTFLRLAALVVNLLVIIYLVIRLRDEKTVISKETH